MQIAMAKFTNSHYSWNSTKQRPTEGFDLLFLITVKLLLNNRLAHLLDSYWQVDLIHKLHAKTVNGYVIHCQVIIRNPRGLLNR